MGGTGWSNPFPLEFGGGPTEIEDVYRTLKSAAGKGGACADDDSIEATWRQAKARGIGLVGTFDERAALQAFPNKATDLLPYYERLLLTSRDPGASDEERRATATSRFTASADFLADEIEADLQTLDSRFSLILATDDETTTTLFGRNFEDLAGAEPYGGGRHATLYPNYSTHFVVSALLDLSGGTPNAEDHRTILAAKRHLGTVLPAWIGFQVITAYGFELDVDFLDYTALSP